MADSLQAGVYRVDSTPPIRSCAGPGKSGDSPKNLVPIVTVRQP